MTARIDYNPDGSTLNAFLADDSFVRIIFGPFGSGKSVACAIELFRRACEQKPDSRKIRRTRWMVVRNSYPQLKRTTIPTWQTWFTEQFGRFTWGPPPSQTIVLPLADSTILNMEVSFTALDGPDAEADLRGFEGTGIWLNELSEIPQSVLNFGMGRVGRYPSTKDGGCTWYGIIADSNPPDSDSWLYKMYEAPPENWRFFKQPGGVIKVDGRWTPNPAAENVKNLPPEYYMKQLAGQPEDWIRVFLGAEFGFAIDGKPVYPEWSDTAHVAEHDIDPNPKLPLYIGLDFGLTPAAVFGQKDAKGRWFIVDELVAEDMGVRRFGEILGAHIDGNYGDFSDNLISAFGDPAGNQRVQTDEQTCLAMIREYARLDAKAAPSNDFTLRREAVAGALNRMIDGKPGFQLSPRCKMLRKGFSGGYHFKRVKVTGSERYHDKADKNEFSHPHDALQYLMAGAGEGRSVMRRVPPHVLPTRQNSSYSPHHWRAGR